MNRIQITGILPALVSPVNEDGSIREAALRKWCAIWRAREFRAFTFAARRAKASPWRRNAAWNWWKS